MKPIDPRYLGAVLLAGLAAAAVAQQPPAPPAAAPAPIHEMRERHSPMDREQMRKRFDERIARREDALKQKLGITPAQEGAWSAWTQALKPPARPAQRASREEFAHLTTPERIDRLRSMRAEREARMDARADATKQLYAALSPDQRKLFDRESLRMMAPHGHRGGHHRG
ncbi:MAG TPA: Spy/CpxP family protein refolding chaperone [Ramlibacter sp.]|uniref:Spy/CpxP family protein refolding chaperone n=1 Tax=Ramlibacter sp. TaxID=1917967 RepID=UPI002D02F3DA|nr:Spy/CpxP family protein refolding chaperone [Ramlibacter sp.]HVZ42534.1 Spy/CpxP family protein refolding chaperone [Ramlibacter sp.]